MTMLGISGKWAVLFLETNKEDEQEHKYIKLTRMVNQEKRIAKLPLIRNSDDVEFILKLLVEFDDAATEGWLHLNTASLKFAFFRQTLEDTIKIDWDNARMAHQGNTQVQ